jgi:hypothetical protein
MKRDISGGIATGWTAGIRFAAVERDFSLLHGVQTGSGATQPPSQWAPGALSSGVKWPACEAVHSPPSSAEIMNGGAITPLPHTSSWPGAYLVKHMNNFT